MPEAFDRAEPLDARLWFDIVLDCTNMFKNEQNFEEFARLRLEFKNLDGFSGDEKHSLIGKQHDLSMLRQWLLTTFRRKEVEKFQGFIGNEIELFAQKIEVTNTFYVDGPDVSSEAVKNINSPGGM